MKKEELMKFADLFVRMGGNIQKGDTLVIVANLSDLPLVHEITSRAYECGAKEVVYNWTDQECSRMRYLHADSCVFDEYPSWMVEFYRILDEKKAVYLHIVSDDPDLLAGVPSDRIQRGVTSKNRALKNHRGYTMTNRVKWSMVGFPSEKWAARVFPGMPSNEAVEKLWQSILEASRANVDDPVEEWRKHNENFQKKEHYLNSKGFVSLKYKNSLGTDLVIELPKGHIWLGGKETDAEGNFFNPNIPSEEIFTMPKRTGVNGRVVSTKPLSYNGVLIEGFEFTFKDGLVIDFKAEKNGDVLKGLLDSDEGSRRLGEVSLVPFDSPINNQQILYYNTLFDENASCHLALGKAYPVNLSGSRDLSPDELLEAGVNDSIIHVDFMIGSKDLSIIGVEPNGTETGVFVNGNFAF